jgi:mannose-6-phosphate isomerase-like protein (cupin superfamily)
VIELEGGCRVVALKEGQPRTDGDLLIWDHFEGALSLRVLELHGSAGLRNDAHDEVLYVIEEDTGIYIPAGETFWLHGDMTIVSSRAPAPPRAAAPHRVRLDDQAVQKTGDRWYRELIQGETTQFVGSIPPGRAPDHFHLYEEVICILKGTGVMWAGARSAPIAPGSCIFLPREQPHCLENTGDGELRLLGVFYPAGSPSVRYPA